MWVSCQKFTVFKGDENNDKNLHRVLRLVSLLGGRLWALSPGPRISRLGEPEARGRGQNEFCQFHIQVQVLSLTASSNIGLDRRGCFTDLGWTAVGQLENYFVFLFVRWVLGSFPSFPMKKVSYIL